MAMTELEARKAKPGERRYMLRDERGLYLEVMTSGSKIWRVRYYEDGKERRRKLGEYPAMSLREARAARDEYKLRFSRGEIVSGKGSTFALVAAEWYEHKVLPTNAESTAKAKALRMEKYLYPAFGNDPVDAITAPALLRVLREVESRGHIDLAHRLLYIMSQICRYAVATGRADRDITADIRGALKPNKHTHHASLQDPSKIGSLMRGLYALEDGSPIVRCAMLVLAYTFVRTGELRKAEWAEIDLDTATWKIPAERMKIKRPHIVPLSSQALKLFREVWDFSGGGNLVFPGRRAGRPISDGTILNALRRMGYGKDEMTGHGFRSMASTVLNESQWSADAIERQLAHVEGNSVRAAYNYAEHLDTRREMMQWWGDWLDRARDNQI
ncbi:MAG TPA: tyrosine-type recombinase/integrase [Synergistaceae bacterium]|nr:tyrosine-type recombinase/integrase [Synergistaceae bacterium]